MAIGTNALVEFYGTQDTLGTSSATVADTEFSIAGDLSTWTNDDDAPMASITALLDWSVAPDSNSAVNLYCRLLNVQSTNDADVPDANFAHIYLGRFPLNDVTTNQYITIDVSLPNGKTSQEYEFYIQNQSGETIQSGWDIYITPKTFGPHA